MKDSTNRYLLTFLAFIAAFGWGFGSTCLNPFHLYLKCWIYSLESAHSFDSLCTNRTYLETTSDFQTVTSKWALMTFTYSIPCLFSSIIGLITADLIGRIETLLLALIFQLTQYALCIISFYFSKLWLFYVARSFGGLAIGFTGIAGPMLLTELSTKKSLPFFIAVTAVGNNTGSLVSVLLGFQEIFGNFTIGWIYSFLTAAGFALTGIFVAIWILVTCKKLMISDDHTVFIPNESKTQKLKLSSLITDSTALFRDKKNFRKAIYCWTLGLFVHGFMGVTSLNYYSSELLLKITNNHRNSIYMTFGLILGATLMNCTYVLTGKKFKKRTLLFLSMGLVTTFTIILGVLQIFPSKIIEYSSVVFVFLARISFDVGAFPISIVLVKFTVDFQHRTAAQSGFMFFATLGVSTMAYIFPHLLKIIGGHVFFLLGGCGLVMLILSLLCLPDIKD